MRKTKKRKLSNVKRLQLLYDEYGVRSTEFYNFCFPFICYILNRNVCGEVDDDLKNECYIKVCRALEKYFNPEKGNIATYIFTVVKNCIKSYYHKENRRLHNEYIVNDEYYFESKKPKINTFKDLDFELLLQNFTFLSLSPQAIDLVKEKVFINEQTDHLFYKAVSWEYLSNN